MLYLFFSWFNFWKGFLAVTGSFLIAIMLYAISSKVDSFVDQFINTMEGKNITPIICP